MKSNTCKRATLNYSPLVQYNLYLADNALILAHRNSEWCGHGPVLEQDIALTNISLDLLGQARSFYQYAAQLINADNQGAKEATEDSLAYRRDARDFSNCLLVELPNGHWGQTILRQFFFSAYQFYLYEQLQRSTDSTIAAIAEKSLKEVTYHLRWSSEWVIRLGDGTAESHHRMAAALEELWMFTGEMFQPAAYELTAVQEGYGIDVAALQSSWMKKVQEILEEATLLTEDLAKTKLASAWMQSGGKQGRHTEHLGYILADLQFLQRAYPDANW